MWSEAPTFGNLVCPKQQGWQEDEADTKLSVLTSVNIHTVGTNGIGGHGIGGLIMFTLTWPFSNGQASMKGGKCAATGLSRFFGPHRVPLLSAAPLSTTGSECFKFALSRNIV